jgi:hypothetical protein
MINILSTLAVVVALLIASGVLLHKSGKQMPPLTDPSETYTNALADTDPAGESPGRAVSEVDETAVERFLDMFRDYTKDNLEKSVENVYAPNVFFRDGFRELHSAAAIREYMIEGLTAVRSCTFDFHDVASEGGEVYIRWVMNLNLLSDEEDEVSRALGLSHIRLNADGKVIFHQDYWDPTDVLYRRIPVANWMIKKVRERL